MSIIRAAAKLIIKEHAARGYSGRVLSFGVPEAHATAAELVEWFGAGGLKVPAGAQDCAERTTNAIGRKLGFVSGFSKI